MSTVDVPAISYTARDFLTIKEALKGYLQAKFPDTWRDFYESNAGIAILDIIAYSHDILSFFTDYTANELFLPTARDRLSVLLLGRLVGYQMRTATSAAALCSSSIGTTYPQAIIIPAGTTLSSLTGVDFLTTEAARIEAGQQAGTITFVEGVNRTDSFSSDGSIFQRFTLSYYSVVGDTVTLTVDGDTWTEVTSLAYADATSQVFSVDYDENGEARITFGNNTNGRVPPNGAAIEVSYRTGGGVAGNIALSQLIGTVQGYKEGVSPTENVNVSVENDTERGSGGEAAETINHAKLWIPRWISANGRAVTEYDYDALGNAFSDPTYGAPAFVKAKLKQEIPELNTVQLFCWGRDTGGNIVNASAGLKNALSTYFNNNEEGAVKCICTHTEVEDGLIVYIDIDIEIRVTSSYAETDVITAAEDAIDDLFTSGDLIPGSDFRISALYDAVHSLAGVQWCLVRAITASYLTTELIGVGNGINKTFSSTLTLDPGSEVIPYSVRMYYGAEVGVLTDDGAGNIIDSTLAVVGSIDYDTGVITGTFAAAPASDVSVNVEFRYTLDYQRGELEATGDGSTQRFEGVTEYSPINPYDPITGQKGIAFSDGNQVITDDGYGNLVGDVDAGGTNTINYSTGAYDFTFANPPANGASIYSTYRQILTTSSQDIPIDKDQLSVKGLVDVTALTS